jgi:hypothetical protein
MENPTLIEIVVTQWKTLQHVQHEKGGAELAPP